MISPVVLLFAALAWGTLAFGAVYPWAYWPMMAALGGIGAWSMARRGAGAGRRNRGVILALAAVALALLVQVIPLPYRLFRALSPAADRFLSQFDLAYTLQPPAWHALSVAPADSLVALALFAIFAFCLVAFSDMFARGALARFVIRFGLFGVAVAVVGVVNRTLMDPNDQHPLIYGFWHPEEGGRPFPPFVNPNHFAGWAVLVVALCGGYLSGLVQASWQDRGRNLRSWMVWLTRPEAGQLPLATLCLVAMIAAVILTNSRSGAMALGVVVIAFALRAAWTVRGIRGKAVAVASVAAAAVGGVLWAGGGLLLAKFGRLSSDTSAAGREGAWRDAWRIFRDFPWFGSGMGTFAEVMLVYQSGTRQAYYTQAHNDYLQLLAEGGLLVGLTAAALIVVIALTARRRLREDTDPLINWIRFGAIAGLLGIAAQSTVEFSLQMPAIAALFVVLIAIAIHRPSSQVSHAHRM